MQARVEIQARAEIGVRAIAALYLLLFAAPLAAQDAVECELLPSPNRMLRAESSKEYLGWLRLTCSGALAAWPDETRITLSLRFSVPLHRASKPLLRMHGASAGAGRKGFVRGGVVTWAGVPFPPRRAGSQPAVAVITGLAVNAAQSPPEIAVVVGVSSGQAAMTLAVTEVAVARVVPGLRGRVANVAAMPVCEPHEPRTATVEISESFPAAFGANRIMLAADSGTMEGPPTVAAGGLEFRRVDGFTVPRSDRLVYSVHGASNDVLESVSLPLTLTGNDEGEAGQNIKLDLSFVRPDGVDRRFLKSATLVVAAYETCGPQARH